ncbi:motility associated factor glycosyltransferase family protein [Paenisporosarcina cavernae]|nr:6-hydroxymethylpterin diphosphokinase MptE-like protein [Paenisporosarcina cavernae]
MNTIHTEISKEGSIIYVYNQNNENSIRLNSKISPRREIQKFLKDFKKDKVYFIIGIGNSEIIRQLLELKLDNNVVLVEPFDDIKINEDLMDDIRSSKLRILTFDEFTPLKVNEVIRHGMGLKYEIIFHPNYEKIDPAILKNTMDIIKKGATITQINKNTERAFREEWITEPVLNLGYFEKSIDIKEYTEKFNNKDAIIVASGPSLKENIDFIKANKDSAYIFATGSAINGLIHQGISPDFVTIIDASKINYDAHFKNSAYTGVIISAGTTNHEILKFHNGPLFMTNFMGDTISFESRPDLITIPSAPSVAIYTLLMTHFMGFQNVYLVGQDLALSDGKYYAEGVKEHKGSLNLGQIIEVKANSGEQTKTTHALSSMLESFNNVMSMLNKTEKTPNVFNLSLHGAKILHVPYKNKSEIFIENSIDKSWLGDLTKPSLSYSKSNEYKCLIENNKNELENYIKKLERFNKKAINLVDLISLLKLVKKMRQNEFIEKHILPKVYSDTQKINNMFEFGFEGNFATNEERLEMLETLDSFIRYVYKYVNEVSVSNRWKHLSEENNDDQ